MNSRVLSIFLATACGIAIGTLVLWSSLGYFGVLVGGLSGYLLYEPRAVVMAFVEAVKLVVAWRPGPAFGWKVFGSVSGALSIFPVIQSLFTIMTRPEDADTVFFCSIIMSIIVPVVFWCDDLNKNFFTEKSKEIAFKQNSLYVAFYVVRELWVLITWSAKMIVWSVKKIPAFAHIFVVVMKITFVTIHSQTRLVCGVDATLGVLLATQLKYNDPVSLLTAAIVGGLCGVAHAWAAEKVIVRMEASVK